MVHGEVWRVLIRMNSVKLLAAQDISLGLIREEQFTALDALIVGAIDCIEQAEQWRDARAAGDQANLSLSHWLFVDDLDGRVAQVGYATDGTLHQNSVSNIFGHQVCAHFASIGELISDWVALDHEVNRALLVKR